MNQRLYAIACGYADGNDAARLASDQVHQLLSRGQSSAEAMPASQPTLSRFENAANRASLYRMGVALAETVIERHRERLGRRKVRHVRIDPDPTDYAANGSVLPAPWEPFLPERFPLDNTLGSEQLSEACVRSRVIICGSFGL